MWGMSRCEVVWPSGLHIKFYFVHPCGRFDNFSHNAHNLAVQQHPFLPTRTESFEELSTRSMALVLLLVGFLAVSLSRYLWRFQATTMPSTMTFSKSSHYFTWRMLLCRLGTSPSCSLVYTAASRGSQALRNSSCYRVVHIYCLMVSYVRYRAWLQLIGWPFLSYSIYKIALV
jgi:hypothetical protein